MLQFQKVFDCTFLLYCFKVVEIYSQNADYFSHLRERLSSLGKHCDYRKYNVDQLQVAKNNWMQFNCHVYSKITSICVLEDQNKDMRELMSIEGFPTGSKLVNCAWLYRLCPNMRLCKRVWLLSVKSLFVWVFPSVCRPSWVTRS
jgi:hypothetical protein